MLIFSIRSKILAISKIWRTKGKRYRPNSANNNKQTNRYSDSGENCETTKTKVNARANVNNENSVATTSCYEHPVTPVEIIPLERYVSARKSLLKIYRNKYHRNDSYLEGSLVKTWNHENKLFVDQLCSEERCHHSDRSVMVDDGQVTIAMPSFGDDLRTVQCNIEETNGFL